MHCENCSLLTIHLHFGGSFSSSSIYTLYLLVYLSLFVNVLIPPSLFVQAFQCILVNVVEYLHLNNEYCYFSISIVQSLVEKQPEGRPNI